MPQIDYFLALTSPNVYMAGTGLEEIAAKHGISLRYKPLDVMALFPRTGERPRVDGASAGDRVYRRFSDHGRAGVGRASWTGRETLV